MKIGWEHGILLAPLDTEWIFTYYKWFLPLRLSAHISTSAKRPGVHLDVVILSLSDFSYLFLALESSEERWPIHVHEDPRQGIHKSDPDRLQHLFRTMADIMRNRPCSLATASWILDFNNTKRLHSWHNWCRKFDVQLHSSDPPPVGAIHG